MPQISVIVPLRDRSGTRLANCLRSLRWQDDAPELELVLADYGSVEEHARGIDELAERFGAVVARAPRQGLWNRSRALNYGIRVAGAPYILCTDADMIFAPNFVASLVAIQQEWADNAMVHCACWDLPERIEERDYDREDFPMLSAAGARRETSGTGACQFARRAFFHEVRGYDEGYQHWGAEDVDMSSRATRYGLEIVWASARTQMLHQWHPTMKHERSWNRRLNNWRFKLTKTWVVKNRSSWGGRP